MVNPSRPQRWSTLPRQAAGALLIAAGIVWAVLRGLHGYSEMPVGIVYGTEDRILDPTLHAQEFAAKVPTTDLELIEGGGHMILISSADQVAAFIARLARRAAAGDAPLAPLGS